MNTEYQALVLRRAQLMMWICIVLAFSGVVAACVALDRQLERVAKIDQENVKW